MDFHTPLEPPLVIENPNLPLIWESWAPSEILVFSWQILQNRYSSKENLFKRKVILDLEGVLCSLCDHWLESISNLFVTCNFSSSVWYVVFRWLGFQVVLPRELGCLFEFVYFFGGRFKVMGGFIMI